MKPEAILAEAIERLQVGISMNLFWQYRSRPDHPDQSQAFLLANCVLSHAILMDPPFAAAQGNCSGGGGLRR
jgi:hypothetical protein